MVLRDAVAVRNELRAHREEAGLSRQKLSWRTGIGAEAIYALETGRAKDVKLSNAMKLADELSKALGRWVTVYDLFPRQSNRPSAPSGASGTIPTSDAAGLLSRRISAVPVAA